MIYSSPFIIIVEGEPFLTLSFFLSFFWRVVVQFSESTICFHWADSVDDKSIHQYILLKNNISFFQQGGRSARFPRSQFSNAVAKHVPSICHVNW